MIKSLSLVALGAVSILLNSCAAPAGSMTKAVGDAVVDNATKDSDPVTKELIRQKTGFGTAPEKTFLQGLGLGL